MNNPLDFTGKVAPWPEKPQTSKWENMPRLYFQTTLFILAAILAAAPGFAQTSTPEINIVRDSSGVHVTFTGGLQSADTPAGPWTDLTDATSPFTTPANKPATFFRAAKKGDQMKITIGSHTFFATLGDNATAAAFKALLPMTIQMRELNGNEKYFNFSVNLPTSASNPGTIESGDLMIYGSNTLVLFYKSFPTSYSYTKLGRIDDAAGLAAAVGSGSVTVTYELKPENRTDRRTLTKSSEAIAL